jgi:hypothetical protein
MSRVRILLAALLAVSALAVVVAAPTGASVHTANSAFCKPIKGIATKLQDAGSNPTKYGAAVWKKFAGALKSSGKHAPKNVKKAANTLASYYGALGSGDVSGLKNTASLSPALTTYFGYVATNCG